ncbi:Glycosyl hydrolases family 2, TIM barrel domain [Anaerosporobacter mobilis DSM 15930]|uniref:beta-galactosidase n=1 Tax=Anaerosporobacter mobilis DSM 15930 TaxID=1120996 RepID=A0A1M7M431_9FIRM|nr:sugar-binding domain-containing protein [Anaerosporobacter mobilis]SHM85431.1 Glycosyl hydrolases family 2, TIM barrel domain [Anaerosporobacter mobilis DSM 15930]
MIKKYNLSGLWNFELDTDKVGIEKALYQASLQDTIELPSTTALSKKGEINLNREEGCLTQVYPFEGFAWFSKEVTISSADLGKKMVLFLERTRLTKVWIDGIYVGEGDSLSTPHTYDLTEFIEKETFTLTVLVSNTDYPTKGGHLTSPDTQTNWNGITGRLELQVYNQIYVRKVQVFSEVETKAFRLHTTIENETNTIAKSTFHIKAVEKYLDENDSIQSGNQVSEVSYSINVNPGENVVDLTYIIGEDAKLWSEFSPVCYELEITDVDNQEVMTVFTGLRKFSSEGYHFTINGTKTFLRGKHDGLIFPLTGAAPTTVKEWIRVLKISKSYGINHYRYHTCCPPEAAFTAADLLGIYMQPELPFWGTLTDESYENHNEEEQQYLIREGERMLDNYGNHASYVMMSLGNELWGSKEKMGEIIRNYKRRDPRPLYTQGSNNFQHAPVIIPEDDFFSGVRFSKTRLFRGSYGMCDAPLGHVQMTMPGTCKDYDDVILPKETEDSKTGSAKKTIEIQYGTGTKTVEMNEEGEELVSHIPVVSHEIGQYAMYPNFKEMDKYTGVLKAENFGIFRERLEEKGLGDLANQYFEATGKLAVACYKEELEAAFASGNLAGFQLLDLQDFSGQGTALVGILDAFMDSKGMVTAKEWRSYCNDEVVLARIPTYIYQAREMVTFDIKLSYFKDEAFTADEIIWEVHTEDQVIEKGAIKVDNKVSGLADLGTVMFTMPTVKTITKMKLHLFSEGTSIDKDYDLWCYPAISNPVLTREDLEKDSCIERDGKKVWITRDFDRASTLLEEGANVLYLPNKVTKSIEGFYCSDFWCYPMFRSISEWMKKPEPVGTMGLLNNQEHDALKQFPCEFYSTPQWYHIVSHADMAILDETNAQYRPIVQMIDNIERNHKLGLLFEANVKNGNLMVCTSRLYEIYDHIEVQHFAESVVNYMLSDSFAPTKELQLDELKEIL